MPTQIPSLYGPLKKYFGFTAFRALQEAIIEDALAGRDLFVLLPTGGGKSLCYQLPALMREGLTVVVSPLIALMRDQVTALEACGVAATFLNSSLTAAESRERMQALREGRYCLLYIAPERLGMSDFLQELKSWKIDQFAIDESHCISEWGHDFRPEYRQLSELRTHFPAVPIMALTATATERVQSDILSHLRLSQPRIYTASFDRPNLTYRVLSKSDPEKQVLEIIGQHQGESGIIYCQSRKTTERVAARLSQAGIKAAPYHAGLMGEERSRHQELFIRDEVNVICATIAFGMGINKSNVRFVIHFDLPKNVEGYYQETGRAGRDGVAADCVLLYSAGDQVKQLLFIEQKSEPKEQDIAREQLRQMVQYAEATACRRKILLGYFGEHREDVPCTACDNCLSPRPRYDGTTVAQKFLSCVYRIREKSGFGVGMKHVVDVLLGLGNEKIKRWHHESLSTFGIGKEHHRKEWSEIASELIRLGYLRQTAGKFSVLELTQEGRRVLFSRETILLTQSQVISKKKDRQEGEVGVDLGLFERLRALRKSLADARGVPAYIVFSDATLRQMARDFPQDKASFSQLTGVGVKKLEEYGQVFLDLIRDFVGTRPVERFREKPAELNPTQTQTLGMFQEGMSPEVIAKARGLALSTIYGHLAEAMGAGERLDIDRLFSKEAQVQIRTAFEQQGFSSLTKVFEALSKSFSYELLRLFRLHLQRKN